MYCLHEFGLSANSPFPGCDPYTRHPQLLSSAKIRSQYYERRQRAIYASIIGLVLAEEPTTRRLIARGIGALPYNIWSTLGLSLVKVSQTVAAQFGICARCVT